MAEKAVKSGKNRARKTIVAIIVIVAVVAAGYFGYTRLKDMAGQVGYEIPDTVVLTKTNLESKVTASGNFASTNPVSVGSNVQYGEVEYVFVEEGSFVNKGDVLAKLKTSDIERNIADTRSSIAEAKKGDDQKRDQAQRAFNDANDQYYADDRQTKKAVDDAKKAYDDAKAAAAADKDSPELKAAVNSTKAAWDQAELMRENTMRLSNSRWYEMKAAIDALDGVDSAKQMYSQLGSLNEQLDNASIISPVTGAVTKVLTEAGRAAMGDMFIIENTESLEIKASVAEYDIIKIEKGMKAHVTSNATGDEAYDGVVTFVAPVAADAGGNFQVKVLVTSAIGQLKPGMTATVEIVTASKKDVFAVPIDAVVKLPDGRTVVYAYEPGFLGGDGPVLSGDGPVAGDGPVVVGNDAAGDGPAVAGNGPAAGDGPVVVGNDAAGGGPANTGDGPVLSSDGPAQAGGGPVRISGGQSGGGPVRTVGGPVRTGGGPVRIGGGQSGGGQSGGDYFVGVPAGADRREIEVKTGMETDYYIEIKGEGLAEGMLILSDPLGRNVKPSGMNPFGMAGGGQAVYAEHADGGGNVTYTVVE